MGGSVLRCFNTRKLYSILEKLSKGSRIFENNTNIILPICWAVHSVLWYILPIYWAVHSVLWYMFFTILPFQVHVLYLLTSFGLWFAAVVGFAFVLRHPASIINVYHWKSYKHSLHCHIKVSDLFAWS